MSERSSYPRKYWWVVMVIVPIALAVIAIVPHLSTSAAPAPTITQSGPGSVVQTGQGSVNVTTNDFSTKLYVTNVSMIIAEYERIEGKPLNDEALKREIEKAVTAAVDGNGTDKVRLLEDLSRKLPLPAIYNNLGVEYAKAGQVTAAQKAFAQALQKDPQYEGAQRNLAWLASNTKLAPAPARPSTSAVNLESSSLPTLLVEALSAAPNAIKEIHVVEAGTKVTGSYKYRYNVQPGSPVIVETGKYDVIAKTAGGGTFVLAKDVEVKDGSLVRINPAALVGYIQVEPITAKDFPSLTEVTVFEAGTTGYRYIYQHSETPGELMPIAPGAYELMGKTADGQDFVLATRVDVKPQDTVRVRSNDQVGAFQVRDPKIAGLKLEKVYLLRAGTNHIAAEADRFTTLIAQAGEPYDVVIKQPGGITPLKKALVAKPGAVIAVP